LLCILNKRNIKEIAKLRGSEELWEVAKLHNCESSYPSVSESSSIVGSCLGC
jgi:hypothetical protein